MQFTLENQKNPNFFFEKKNCEDFYFCFAKPIFLKKKTMYSKIHFLSFF